ncbi:MAG TPA: carboxypeptidase regulatory-like domain-containing protein [Armatimonadetes bacterium]|nr:carboxypeptidase regulatory-like domain-containing protein [Armatimonadota bacterium]
MKSERRKAKLEFPFSLLGWGGVLFLWLVLPLRAETLTGKVTWTRADSPVSLGENLIIAPGATLTIGPGVTVVFAPNPNRRAEPEEGGGLRIVVRGTLRAVGSAEEPILFRGQSEQVDPPGKWNFGRPYDLLRGWNEYEGIIFTDEAVPYDEVKDAGCVVRYCVFEGAYQPLDIRECAVRVEFCTFRRMGAGGDRGPGVTLRSGEVRFCQFEWGGASAARLEGPGWIDYCVFHKGFGDAIVARAGTITNCTVQGFAGAALTGEGGEYEVWNCLFTKCSAGLRIDSANYARPSLFHCTFLNLGWPLPQGAIYLTRRPDAPAPQRVFLRTEGVENRILIDPDATWLRTPKLIHDAVGGAEVHVPNVWWGREGINPPQDPRFVGNGTTFSLNPVLGSDPQANTVTFEGLVTDGANRPVSAALVWVEDANGPATFTDRQGRYTIAGIQPGWYTLHAYQPGLGEVAKKALWAYGGQTQRVDLRLPRAAR